MLLLGGGTPAAHAALEDLASGLILTGSSRRPPVSLLALGVDRHLLPVFEHTLFSVPLSPPLWVLSARPDAARWNPLHAPWLSTPALARLLVDLADVVVPFAPAARSLAISYLATFITAFRLLPNPWFTFDDLYRVLESGSAGPALIDRAVASVWEQYHYQFAVETPGYSSVPDILREVVITDRDVAASGLDSSLGPCPPFPDNYLSGRPDSFCVTFDWKPAGPDSFTTTVDYWGFFALCWLLSGNHVALRSFDGGLRPRQLFPSSIAGVSEPSLARQTAAFRLFDAYVALFEAYPRRLHLEVKAKLREFLGMLTRPPLDTMFSPPRPVFYENPVDRCTVPSFDHLQAEGAVVVSTFAGHLDPDTARLLDVLAKRLWLSSALLSRDPSFGAVPPSTTLFCPRYDRTVLPGIDDVAADAAAFVAGSGRGLVPVLAVPSLAASSAESVGEFWFGQVAKCVIQSDFQCPGGAEPRRPFGDHSGLSVEAFDNATGELPPGSEPVQNQVAVRAQPCGQPPSSGRAASASSGCTSGRGTGRPSTATRSPTAIESPP